MRLTPAERRQLNAVAKRDFLNPSTWARRLILLTLEAEAGGGPGPAPDGGLAAPAERSRRPGRPEGAT